MFNIIIKIKNIIIFIIINILKIIINKFEKILLLSEKTIPLIWRVRLEIIIITIIFIVVVVVINKIEKNYKFDLKGKIKNYKDFKKEPRKKIKSKVHACWTHLNLG